ncbi:norbelladine synthase-like [Salvia splendens]|uniref:norbelladine synthase-like n=1 Tax=Salvia splendens TaxID=180675 RepID=UPI001C257490|nr:norbelladine synthase-like [Salvia splendens]
MYGTASDERAVKVPASEAWKLIGTLQLAYFIEESLPHLISKIDVIQGDGSAGTILHATFPPGREDGLKWFKEKFTVVDDEKRVKVAEVVEGGYLDAGFTMYRITLEVTEAEEEEEQCVIRTTLEYELKEEGAANAFLASIQPLAAIMQLAADSLQRNYTHNS